MPASPAAELCTDTRSAQIRAEIDRRNNKRSIAQQTLPVDWDEVRACFIKGLSLQELSDKYGIAYGTLRSRSSREKWCNTAAAAKKAVNQGATAALAASAAGWISKIDATMHAALDNVIAKGVHKLHLRDLQVALDCADKANRIARQNYGLDQQSQQQRPVALQVNVHTTPGSMLPSAAVATDIIDVPALPDAQDATSPATADPAVATVAAGADPAGQ